LSLFGDYILPYSKALYKRLYDYRGLIILIYSIANKNLHCKQYIVTYFLF